MAGGVRLSRVSPAKTDQMRPFAGVGCWLSRTSHVV